MEMLFRLDVVAGNLSVRLFSVTVRATFPATRKRAYPALHSGKQTDAAQIHSAAQRPGMTDVRGVRQGRGTEALGAGVGDGGGSQPRLGAERREGSVTTCFASALFPVAIFAVRPAGSRGPSSASRALRGRRPAGKGCGGDATRRPGGKRSLITDGTVRSPDPVLSVHHTLLAAGGASIALFHALTVRASAIECDCS